MSYELLENDLTDSTLWLSCSKDAKLLFITILSKAFGSDVVRTPLPVLYQRAGLSEAEGAKALAELMRPDPASKFRGEEGRRVVEVEDEHGRGLWLPSYASRRKRYLNRNRKQNQRDRARSDASRSVTPRHAESRSVTPNHDASPSVTPGHEKSPLEQSRAEDRAEDRADKDPTPPFPLAGSREGGRVRRVRNRTVVRELRLRERAEKDLPKEREIRKAFVGANSSEPGDRAVKAALGYVPSERLAKLDSAANLAPHDDEGGPF